MDEVKLCGTRDRLVETLLKQRQNGTWEGELSTSALSTATAIAALHAVDRENNLSVIEDALNWLATNQNADGGWGDTVRSHSNISTTALCWGALGLISETNDQLETSVLAAETWLKKTAGGLEPETLRKAIMKRYGKDHTFSVPILTMLAICGRLGPPEQAWQLVAPLPFELAAVPRKFYKTVRMPVVSYALPALIAIGQAIYHHRGAGNPVSRFFREKTKAHTLNLLESIQPENGGFLEAVPLTSFVCMSMASMGKVDHPVVRKGIQFILSLVRPDGSLPIDTHLQTWVTTLSINALNAGGRNNLTEEDCRLLTQWLIDQQYRVVHPYTGAAPGGWAWTPLPGGVPDADDTSGAVLALANLCGDRRASPVVEKAAGKGIDWLVDLQNRDGGIPTFCRGWGTLPFDKSCPDITAHALLAMHTWRKRGLECPGWPAAQSRMRRYLKKQQQADGSWLPLWFGNQDHPNEQNPTYGTAKVVLALAQITADEPRLTQERQMLKKGFSWLIANQNEDGGWGAGKETASTIEETALALDALTALQEPPKAALRYGLNALVELTDEGRRLQASPIGFYFANLWYYEKLYPLTFAVSALERATGQLKPNRIEKAESLTRGES
ncbi:MAG: prenyltransferase/squalene oxidase repeat-containing protein [Acidobacteriota bacterium]|nr:prenyltransferase/squalene oxidase repeat-containing protein [Acidobacteriota bacterium]